MRVIWSVVHNCVAHFLEGLWCLATLGYCENPEWLNRFHDWTADKAWGGFE